MSEGVQWINRKLQETYGKALELDKPHFRIVFSTSQLETCYRETEVFSDGGIFLRQEKGISEGPKYPLWPDLWILERLYTTVGNPYLENVTKFSYEPIWVFGAGNSEKQPIWRAVEMMVHGLLHKKKKFLTRDDYATLEMERMAKEKEKCLDIIKNDSPWIPSQLANGGAVVVPSNYESTTPKQVING